jgi:hypothetical protein
VNMFPSRGSQSGFQKGKDHHFIQSLQRTSPFSSNLSAIFSQSMLWLFAINSPSNTKCGCVSFKRVMKWFSKRKRSPFHTVIAENKPFFLKSFSNIQSIHVLEAFCNQQSIKHEI